jgi:hypothetical protein
MVQGMHVCQISADPDKTALDHCYVAGSIGTVQYEPQAQAATGEARTCPNREWYTAKGFASYGLPHLWLGCMSRSRPILQR